MDNEDRMNEATDGPKFYFVKNFNGLDVDTLEEVVKTEGEKRKKSRDSDSAKNTYPVEIDYEDLREQNISFDVQACVEKAKQKNGGKYYQSEVDHVVWADNMKGGNKKYWWVTHIVRQMLPDRIKFYKWNREETKYFSDSKKGNMWKIIENNDVWGEFIKPITFIIKFSYEKELRYFKKFPDFHKKMKKSITRGVGFEKFEKYWNTLRHRLFHFEPMFLIPSGHNKYSFPNPRAHEKNQARLFAPLIEIMQFILSDKFIEHCSNVERLVGDLIYNEDAKHFAKKKLSFNPFRWIWSDDDWVEGLNQRRLLKRLGRRCFRMRKILTAPKKLQKQPDADATVDLRMSVSS